MSNPPGEMRDERFAWYWDSLVLGEPNSAPGEIDSASQDLAQRLLAAARAKTPAGARLRAMTALQLEFNAKQNGKGSHMEIAIKGDGKALPAPPPQFTPVRGRIVRQPARWQRVASYVSLAALLIVLLGSTYFTLRNSHHAAVPPLQAGTPESQPVSSDVPMYKANPARTGVNPGPGPQGNPVVLWKVSLGGQINSSPAIVGDVIYIGSDDGGLYALNKRTGATIWRFAAESAVNSSPAVVNRIAYAGSEDGTLYAVDTRTGKEVWRKTAAAPNAGPVVEGGVLYTGADDGNLYALDAATGAEIWAYQMGDAGARSATYSDGVVYACSADGVLHAVDATNGTELWSLQGASGTPVVADGTVFQGGGPDGGPFFLAGLDAKTGAEIWRIETAESFAPSAVVNGVMYAPSYDGSMYSFDAKTGLKRWQFKTTDFNNAPPAIVGDTLYFGSHDHHLYAVDAQGGTEQWNFEADGEIAYGPAVTGGVAYFGTFSGTLYAVGGSDESPTKTTVTTTASPVVATEATPASMAASVELIWQTGDPGEKLEAGEIAISSTGDVYVIDIGRNRIGIFASDGTFREWWGKTGTGPGEFNFISSNGSSSSIDTDADGNIYVFDGFNSRVQKFDANRTFLKEWGSFGTGNGRFNQPFGEVDADRGLIYIADFGNNRIQVFDLDGNFLDKWGSYGRDDGQFTGPIGIASDFMGNVYVVEQYGHRIQKFDSTGRFLASFGSLGAGPGQFVEAWGIVVDDAGNIYLADFQSNRIQVFDPEGAVIAVIDSVSGSTPFSGLGTISMDADGSIYVGEEFNGRVTKLKVTLPVA